MHVAHLDDQSSPFAVSSAPPFPIRSGGTEVLVTGAPGRRYEQRHYSAVS